MVLPPNPVLISRHCLWSVSVTGVSPWGHGLSIFFPMALPSACHMDLLHWTKLSCSKLSPRELHICVCDAPKAQDVFRVQLWNYLLRHIKRISHINLYPWISHPKWHFPSVVANLWDGQLVHTLGHAPSTLNQGWSMWSINIQKWWSITPRISS